MSVEQDIDFLNSDEEGDAFMAWAIMSTKLDGAPKWVSDYFAALMDKVDAFDPHDDLEIALTNQLEVPVIRKRKQKRLGEKSPHDYAHIFDWVAAWQISEDANLEQALWKYIDVHELDPDLFETIKSAYHKVRKARLQQQS
ncbi:hypothetical protein [Roseobacter sp. OBYS 0001]|uniref:hypothetical protein n=1 Tax=Roseobacter sp. OBYS 0001 TaxID=882651 RepID=UPI001BC52931|nr:hypothetical protein [Roseobacter sp. OBYS 0001]GIT86164.1 hypothetical protein ROBYS_11800 [Roseobacter sp. OBYS 0001]